MTVRKPTQKRGHPIALAIVAGSAAMLLAAWLTSSVAIGWALFVVVGVATGLTVRKMSSITTALSDAQAAPVAGRTVLPRPVEILNERFTQISALYSDARHTMTPEDAARAAVSGALEHDVRDEVLAYYDGHRDSAYGAGSGVALRAAVVGKLESLHARDEGPALVA